MSIHLVTGGAGFLGSALVRRLLEGGDEVVVLDRMSRGKEERVPDEALLLQADIRDPLPASLECDCVWHLAYVQGTQTFYANPRDVIDIALRGIVNVLDHVEWTGADLVLVSSSEVYQNPPPECYPTAEDVPLVVPDVTNPRYSYGAGKIASEVAALAYAEPGRRTMIVRPHNIIGPDMGEDHVVPQLARRVQGAIDGKLRIQGDGSATRSFCHVDDATDGLVAVWERGADRTVYHLGNPHEETTIAELAGMISRYYGRDLVIEPSEAPQGSPSRRLPDITRLRQLNYEPKVTLRDALDDTLEWYRL